LRVNVKSEDSVLLKDSVIHAIMYSSRYELCR